MFHLPGRTSLLQHVSPHTPSSTLVSTRTPALNRSHFIGDQHSLVYAGRNGYKVVMGCDNSAAFGRDEGPGSVTFRQHQIMHYKLGPTFDELIQIQNDGWQEATRSQTGVPSRLCIENIALNTGLLQRVQQFPDYTGFNVGPEWLKKIRSASLHNHLETSIPRNSFSGTFEEEEHDKYFKEVAEIWPSDGQDVYNANEIPVNLKWDDTSDFAKVAFQKLKYAGGGKMRYNASLLDMVLAIASEAATYNLFYVEMQYNQLPVKPANDYDFSPIVIEEMIQARKQAFLEYEVVFGYVLAIQFTTFALPDPVRSANAYEEVNSVEYVNVVGKMKPTRRTTQYEQRKSA